MYQKLIHYICLKIKCETDTVTLICSFTAFWNSDSDAEPVITPYIINNEAKFYEKLMSVNGNQSLFSQRATMEKAGIKDVDKMQEEIKKENLIKDSASNNNQS